MRTCILYTELDRRYRKIAEFCKASSWNIAHYKFDERYKIYTLLGKKAQIFHNIYAKNIQKISLQHLHEQICHLKVIHVDRTYSRSFHNEVEKLDF